MYTTYNEFHYSACKHTRNFRLFPEVNPLHTRNTHTKFKNAKSRMQKEKLITTIIKFANFNNNTSGMERCVSVIFKDLEEHPTAIIITNQPSTAPQQEEEEAQIVPLYPKFKQLY